MNPWLYVIVGGMIVAVLAEAWPAAGGVLLALLVIVMVNEAGAKQLL